MTMANDSKTELEKLKNIIQLGFEDERIRDVAFEINASSYKLYRGADIRTYDYVYCLDEIIRDDEHIRTVSRDWEKLIENEFNKKMGRKNE